MRSFPDVEGPETPVSQGGGYFPVWAPEADALFYRTQEGMWKATVETEPVFRVLARKPLFEETGVIRGGRAYDIAPDGRFLVIKLTGSDPADQIILVQNWTDDLQRLVPTSQ